MGRIKYLDGLRGVAALQVLLLHLLSCYMPGLVFAGPDHGTISSEIHGSPLGLLYDGSAAVYLFFLISGFAITRAYDPRSDYIALTTARVVRFALPLTLACYVTWAIGNYAQSDYLTVAGITGSGWMGALWHYPRGAMQPLRDALINGLLVGYPTASPIAAVLPGLTQPLAQSLLPPMWTLNTELRGTILVLLLARLRMYRPRLWIFVCLAAMLLFGLDQTLCFIVGHTAAVARLEERLPKTGWLLGLPLLVIGAEVCCQAVQGWPAALGSACGFRWLEDFACGNSAVVLRIYGCIAMFLGITLSRPMRGLFIHPALQRLGRISFPLYLIHWPIVFGVCSEIFLWLNPQCGLLLSSLLTMISGFALSILAACTFTPLDEAAQHIAKYIRYRAVSALEFTSSVLGKRAALLDQRLKNAKKRDFQR